MKQPIKAVSCSNGRLQWSELDWIDVIRQGIVHYTRVLLHKAVQSSASFAGHTTVKGQFSTAQPYCEWFKLRRVGGGSQKESGSLITANRAAEQGKTVFAIPGHIYSEFHQGCHQLIREGAILVDHPEQILEDLALPTHWHAQSTAAVSATSTLKMYPMPWLFPKS